MDSVISIQNPSKRQLRVDKITQAIINDHCIADLLLISMIKSRKKDKSLLRFPKSHKKCSINKLKEVFIIRRENDENPKFTCIQVDGIPTNNLKALTEKQQKKVVAQNRYLLAEADKLGFDYQIHPQIVITNRLNKKMLDMLKNSFSEHIVEPIEKHLQEIEDNAYNH
ncbi:MAG: hypothetical protein CFH44_01076 [Proteobacteria bacterium]|nr:MAG: hypothetical protein CFH44_01076 [Pseudomonadota bacterium]|tara:strand:- start:714 stop:1217 length:504 start_codon:yes stop_codon:yes gene_type:complete